MISTAQAHSARPVRSMDCRYCSVPRTEHVRDGKMFMNDESG
jgi:hypothetical protein